MWSTRASHVLQILTEGLQPLSQQPCCVRASEASLSTSKGSAQNRRAETQLCPLLVPPWKPLAQAHRNGEPGFHKHLCLATLKQAVLRDAPESGIRSSDLPSPVWRTQENEGK